MKLVKVSTVSLIVLALTACGGGEEQAESLDDLANELTEDLSNIDLGDSGWDTQTDDEFCEIEIPNKMNSMDELNAEATIKYGVTEQDGSVVLENYVIVIPETHEEIAAYDLDFEFTTESYTSLSVDNMGEDLLLYEVLTEDAEVETINGMEAIVNEMEGSMMIGEGQTIDIYYMMGVFKGEKAFYQVLSWTVADQKSEFKADMEKMIRSFKEI